MPVLSCWPAESPWDYFSWLSRKLQWLCPAEIQQIFNIKALTVEHILKYILKRRTQNIVGLRQK